MILITILIIVTGILLVFVYAPRLPEAEETARIRFPDGTLINAELADSPTERLYGLSGKEEMGQYEGMLFVYGELGDHVFWMYGMFFPIDIIWLKQGEIVGIDPNVPIPEGEIVPERFSPSQVDTVLEVNAGVAEKHNLQVGDNLDIIWNK